MIFQYLPSKKKKGRKVRKFRQHEELADEDLDLIREAQGVDLEKERMRKEREEREKRECGVIFLGGYNVSYIYIPLMLNPCFPP